jgi:SAM-dependent methyltransferase
VNVLGRFYEQSRHRFYTGYCERKFGVSTAGFIEARDLGIENPDSMAHSPLGYEYIFWALRAIPFPAADVVFLDYGSGKGRVLVAASTLPFRKVLGVEISERLVDIARGNLAHMKHRRAANVEVHHGDAALFPVPDDVNVVFFFNPFAGQTLTDVVHRIEQSLRSCPRDLFIIFFNHGEFDQRAQGQPWLRKVHETTVCGMYRAMQPAALNC